MLVSLLAGSHRVMRMTNSPSTWNGMAMFHTAFKILAAICLVFYLCHLVQHISCAWANAAPVPANTAHWPSWLWTTLTRRTLPALTSETWKNQTVVITGGSNGLGASVAKLLLERGAKVISLDKSKPSFKHMNMSTYHCDVSKQHELTSVARSIISTHGSPTIVINNAGMRNGLPLLALPNDALRRYVYLSSCCCTIETNTLAHFWILKEFLPHMVAEKKGHVVTISSLLGYTLSLIHI